MSTRKSVVCLLSLVLVLSLAGCGETPEEKARRVKLASVKKIALVCFVGKSKTNPKGKIHKPLIDGMYEAFRAKAADTRTTEFIPVERVVADQAYQQVAKIQMPEGALSPVEGLTYIRYGVEEGQSFDCGPLVRSLGVDALFAVITEFSVAIRENGSSPFLTAEVHSGLVAPPEETLWGGQTLSFEEAMPVSIVSHPKLMGSIGAKWVFLRPPSEEEYAELMKIAINKRTKLPTQAGQDLFDGLINSIQTARQSAKK